MTGWDRRRVLLVLTAASPGVLVAMIGVFHPAHLTDATAQTWLGMHVALLPLFPLLALAPWLVARHTGAVAGWVALALGYVFATFYTGLDLLAGAAAGALQLAGSPDRNIMFNLGNDLAVVAVWTHLGLAVLVSLLVAIRAGRRHLTLSVAGGVLVAGASWSFLDSHIYWPRGVITMIVLAAGWAVLAAVVPLRPAARTP
ncbi:MAG: hypothetical protein H0V32_10995 [Nocardioidaceae bacterium]|nr:hypothetical protein [Nocardioidaceae bacterium]MDQ3324157.1 hypothetical protein [Actinomycetota bacterium]